MRGGWYEQLLRRVDREDRSARYLLELELEVWRTRRHWVVLLKPTGWLLAALVLAGVLAGADPAVDDVTSVLVLVAVVNLLLRVLAWWDFEYILTDRRILVTRGIPTRRVASMSLRKVTDMSYVQTVPGRIAGYGSFVVESAGQVQALSKLVYVPRSHAFYRAFGSVVFKPSGGRE